MLTKGKSVLSAVDGQNNEPLNPMASVNTKDKKIIDTIRLHHIDRKENNLE